MKKTIFFALALSMATNMFAELYNLKTPNISFVVDATKGKKANFVYFGPKLSETELNSIQIPRGRMDLYLPYGMQCTAESAMAMTHADGNKTTELIVENISQKSQTITARNGSSASGTHIIINMLDPSYNTEVSLHYFAYNDVDMIETWTEIKNKEKKDVILTQYSSGVLPIRRGNVYLSHLYGSWGNEGRLSVEKIEPGMKIIKNHDGVRNAHTDHAEVMFSLDGSPLENTGAVIGAALCYSGNYKLRIDTDDSDYHYFFAGINEDNSEYTSVQLKFQV